MKKIFICLLIIYVMSTMTIQSTGRLEKFAEPIERDLEEIRRKESESFEEGKLPLDRFLRYIQSQLYSSARSIAEEYNYPQVVRSRINTFEAVS